MSAALNRTATPRLRVADAVLRAFDYACVMRDLKTACMLLAILEDMMKRKICRFGGDRRSPNSELDGARERLRRVEACNARKFPTAAGHATL